MITPISETLSVPTAIKTKTIIVQNMSEEKAIPKPKPVTVTMELNPNVQLTTHMESTADHQKKRVQ